MAEALTTSVEVEPSTSKNENHNIQSQSKDDTETVRCLDLIQKITKTLKTETDPFITILGKVLDLLGDGETSKKKMMYSILEETLSDILEADAEELVSAKKHFDRLFFDNKYNHLLIDESDLDPLHVIGEGSYSIVRLGLLRRSNGTRKVAIKIATELKYKDIIHNEITIMNELKHKNILKAFGKIKNEPGIVLELMDLGSIYLAIYVTKFSVQNILKFLDEIASAMEYIIEKKYLHRDLACRNVFLNLKKQCKLGDFKFSVYVGNTNGTYHERVHNPPDANLSPETYQTKVFTVANEIWAMGVLCWEIFYLVQNADQLPPPHLSKELHLQLFLIRNKQLPKLDLCPHELHKYVTYNILNKNQKPSERPSFTEIRAKIKEIASNEK